MGGGLGSHTLGRPFILHELPTRIMVAALTELGLPALN